MSARVIRDIVYSTVMGFRPLALDLYLPDAAEAPVILFVHGGGWRMGSRSVFCPTLTASDSFETLAAAGFAVVSIDYRLSGEAHFPAQVDDARSALVWVGEHAAEYELDASRLVLWGESAGATIAALVGLEPGARVSGIIDWYGPSDLIAMAAGAPRESVAASRETEWLGRSALDDPGLARAASPVFAVHRDAPPFFVAHGTADRFVPISQSEQLVAALQEHGVDVRFTAVDGANHMWRDIEHPEALVRPALEFALERTATAPNGAEHADHD